MGHNPSVFDMAMSYQNQSNMIIIYEYAGILLVLRTIKMSIKRKGRTAYFNGENIFYSFFLEILNDLSP